MPDPSNPTSAELRERWARAVRSRLSAVSLSPAREDEIVDELSQHLDDRYQELIAGGAAPEEAMRAALADFRAGNVLAQHMASLRQAQAAPVVTPGAPGGHLLGDLGQDLRYAARTFWKQPGLRCRGGPDPCARDWRHHCHLQRRLRRVAQAASVRHARSIGDRTAICAARRRHESWPGHIPDLSREPEGLRGHRRVGCGGSLGHAIR